MSKNPGKCASFNTTTDLRTPGTKGGAGMAAHYWTVSSKSIELLPENICMPQSLTLYFHQ